jgi:hypothetical protein
MARPNGAFESWCDPAASAWSVLALSPPATRAADARTGAVMINVFLNTGTSSSLDFRVFER